MRTSELTIPVRADVPHSYGVRMAIARALLWLVERLATVKIRVQIG